MIDPNPSKSAKKREFLALQELGVQLMQLSDEQLDSIEIDESLRIAVKEARRISTRSALRRQKQLIGKIMRHVDAARVRAELDQLGQQERVAKAVFKRAEDWRDRIVSAGPSAITKFADEAARDVSGLRALYTELSATVHDEHRKKIRRQIFREVHRHLLSEMQNDACKR